MSVPPFAFVSDSASYRFQWPDNYDFESTRALNNPLMHPHGHSTRTATNDSPLPDDSKNGRSMDDEKNDGVAADARSVSDEPIVPLVDTSDLDPVALKKAFRFAAWSSVALVRTLFPFSPLRRIHFSSSLVWCMMWRRGFSYRSS